MVEQDWEKMSISRGGSSALQFKREGNCEGTGLSQVKVNFKYCIARNFNMLQMGIVRTPYEDVSRRTVDSNERSSFM